MAINWRERFQSALNVFPPTQRHALHRAMTKQAIVTSRSAATAISSTTLTPHTELVLDLLGGRYVLRGMLYLSIGAAANNIKLDLNGGTITNASGLASTVAGLARLSLANGTESQVALTALNTLIDGSTTNAWICCELDATLVLDGPGTIALQYAQSASGATNSTISAGSFIHAIMEG